MTGELTPKPGETSADFKLRIEQVQKELAAKRPATSVAPPPEPSAPTAKEPEQPQPQAKTPTPPAPSAPAQPPAVAPQTGAAVAPPAPSKPEDKVDPLEWAKKKGLKTPEDIARSLRALEGEFHRRNQNPGPAAPPAPGSSFEPPRPAYAPPMAPPYQPQPGGYEPAPYQPQPRYQPVPAPLPRQQVQWLADTYQMDPADVERLAPMLFDMVATAQKQSDVRIRRVERDNARNSEMFRLMQDPSFQNPEVQFELHQVLEQNPRIFELEPAPYTFAYNQALLNIARKYVTPGNEPPAPPTAPPLSSRPPQTLGSDGGVSGKSSPDGVVSPDSFPHLSLEEKKKVLTSIGARPGS